jgi:hypothetical protein
LRSSAMAWTTADRLRRAFCAAWLPFALSDTDSAFEP